MSLPANYSPAIGDTLVELSTGKTFRVLCSCASSKPRSHTRRFIAANPALYALPGSQAAVAAQTPALSPQP